MRIEKLETRGDQRESDWNFSRCMPIEFGMNDKKIRHYGLEKALPGIPEEGSEKPEI